MTGRAPWSRADAAIAVAVAVLALLTRAAVRSTAFYSMDSGLLAAGATDYDFAGNTPHPPYYPLVVALMRALWWLDPFAALTWLSIAASAGLAAGTYAVGWRLGGRGAGLLAAGTVLASPVALLNGAVPLSYALEGAASVAVALVALASHTGRLGGRRGGLLLGVVASLAIGIRPSSLVLLAPLGLWATWRRGQAFRWALAGGAVTTLAWFVPTLVAGGGLADFRFGIAYQGRAYILSDPVWRTGWVAVQDHGAWLLHHLRLGLPSIGLLAAGAVVGSFGIARSWPRPAASFLCAWLLPGAAFYVFVYAGWPVYPNGYLMALLPAFAVAGALAVRGLWRAVRLDGVPVAAKAVGMAAVASLALQPVAWVGAWDDAMAPARAAEAWQASLEGLEETFPPNETALYTFNAGHWLLLEHPDYLTWVPYVFTAEDGFAYVQMQEQRSGRVDDKVFDDMRDGLDDAPHPIPSWVRRVAIIDGHPREPALRHLADGVEPHVTVLPGGRAVTWFDPAGQPSIEAALFLFDVENYVITPRSPPPR